MSVIYTSSGRWRPVISPVERRLDWVKQDIRASRDIPQRCSDQVKVRCLQYGLTRIIDTPERKSTWHKRDEDAWLVGNTYYAKSRYRTLADAQRAHADPAGIRW